MTKTKVKSFDRENDKKKNKAKKKKIHAITNISNWFDLEQ